MKKMTFVLLSLILSLGMAIAQNKQITGTVISAEDGEPIIGASVVANGTTVGTVTDFDGNFSFSIPESVKTLRISYIGMATITENVKPKMRIVLKSDNKLLDEIVVTAIGMKKSEKSLGYSASTVKNDDLIIAKSGSVMTGLVGKVAGVNISSAGGAGTSQKVVVRGFSSFSGNQPLYVVDGVPLQNGFQGEDSYANSVDFGNQANDINPDDVESVTILKGASATALYGSRAANGVVMITTKRAAAEQLSVTYDGSFMGSNVLRVPQTQNVFGQGWPGWNPMENGSWGPKLDGREHAWGAFSDGAPGSLEPKVKPFSYVEDNMRNFYTNGFEANNNVSVRVGNENLGLVASYGNVSSTGVLPNDADKYSRNTFSLRGNAKYKRFSADINMNYVRKDIMRAAAGQGNDGASMFTELIQHAVDVDFQDLKDYDSPYNNTDNFYTAYAENPYWVLANNKNKYQDDRIYGKIELNYQITDQIKAVGRLGGDFTNSRQKRWNQKTTFTPGSWSELGGKKEQPGTYTERTDYLGQIDVTALLTANYTIGDDITLGGIAGWNLNQQTDSYLKSYLYGLDQPGWYNLENGVDKPLSTSIFNERRLIGAFAQAEFGYKNYWFVNLSARNDWSSTLPKGKNSFFYGGVNTSLLLTDLFEDWKSEKLNFLKIRAAWGQTGNDAPIYRTSPYFIPTQVGVGFGDIYLPLNNASGLTESNRLPNTNLKPEITTEWELGVTTNMFNNRVILDVAYYDKVTKDQIISASLAPETRYTSMTRNVGKISNKGIEAALTVVPIQTSAWTWEVGATFTKNWSKVLELWDNVDEYVLANAYSVDFVAKVGEPLGVFKVPQIAKVKEGEHAGKTIVSANGLEQIESGKKDVIGSSVPNFVMGFNTKLSWKNITLNALFDWRNGGYFYSYTSQLMHFNGNATPTVFNDRQPFVVPNSVKVVNGQYVENNIPVTWTNAYNYYNNASNTSQYRNFVLPKDHLKLREIALSYNFPRNMLAKTPFSALQVSLIGRNLFMWTPKANNYVDPEGTNYGNDINSELGEFGANPSTRNFGGGIKATF